MVVIDIVATIGNQEDESLNAVQIDRHRFCRIATANNATLPESFTVPNDFENDAAPLANLIINTYRPGELFAFAA